MGGGGGERKVRMGGGDGDEGLDLVGWRTKWSGEEDMGHTMIERGEK